MNAELKTILECFATCEWNLIDAPAKAYLEGNGVRETLIAAIRQADAACGSCGCEFDALYKRAPVLLDKDDTYDEID